MLPFGVTIPVTVPQRSEIPEGLTNNPVYDISSLRVNAVRFFTALCLKPNCVSHLTPRLLKRDQGSTVSDTVGRTDRKHQMPGRSTVIVWTGYHLPLNSVTDIWVSFYGNRPRETVLLTHIAAVELLRQFQRWGNPLGTQTTFKVPDGTGGRSCSSHLHCELFTLEVITCHRHFSPPEGGDVSSLRNVVDTPKCWSCHKHCSNLYCWVCLHTLTHWTNMRKENMSVSCSLYRWQTPSAVCCMNQLAF